MDTKKLCIFGAGGAAKDVFVNIMALGIQEEFLCFLESDDVWIDRKVLGFDVKPLSFFDVNRHRIIVAVGDSEARKKITDSLPVNTQFYSLIHPGSMIAPGVQIGEGSFVGAGCIITYDVKIGKHAYINIATTITHDCRIGDYFTSAPSVNISGNCTVGNCVYIGTNAAIREKTVIADHIVVGMGSIVLDNLVEPGTYIGIPARKFN